MNRCSGSLTTRDPSTSSTVVSERNIASGLSTPLRRFFTTTRARCSLVTPDSRMSRCARKAKYSPKSGYSLAFKGGTNVTTVPPALDTKTRLTFKKMTVTQQGQVLRPAGGTVDYRFLGQRGKANLLDFLAP